MPDNTELKAGTKTDKQKKEVPAWLKKLQAPALKTFWISIGLILFATPFWVTFRDNKYLKPPSKTEANKPKIENRLKEIEKVIRNTLTESQLNDVYLKDLEKSKAYLLESKSKVNNLSSFDFGLNFMHLVLFSISSFLFIIKANNRLRDERPFERRDYYFFVCNTLAFLIIFGFGFTQLNKNNAELQNLKNGTIKNAETALNELIYKSRARKVELDQKFNSLIEQYGFTRIAKPSDEEIAEIRERNTIETPTNIFDETINQMKTADAKILASNNLVSKDITVTLEYLKLQIDRIQEQHKKNSNSDKYFIFALEALAAHILYIINHFASKKPEMNNGSKQAEEPDTHEQS